MITEHTDARIRLDHIDDASSPPIVQYAYDAGNGVVSRAYRNGVSAAYTYNANNWITSLQHSKGGLIAGFSYAYDNEGNRQYESKTPNTTQSEAYQYDAAYRVIDYKVGTLVGSTVPAPTTQTAYTLDPVGNWNSKTTDAITQNRTHNAVSEVTQIDATVLAYDLDGNTKNDGTYTYTYDEENRLTKVTRNSDSAVVGQYQYDAFGGRVRKTADPAGPPVTTLYFYDDARIIEDQDSGGSTQASYVYGNYLDEVFTMDRGGQTYYYQQNASWSTEAITDGTSAPVERYSYDAYGAATVTDGLFSPIAGNAWGTPHSAIGNPWLFTGRQLDEETGLYDYRARSYSPKLGRFIQRDPAGYAGSGPNLYEYVNGNPLNWLDPFGLAPSVVLNKDPIPCPTAGKKPCGTVTIIRDFETGSGNKKQVWTLHFQYDKDPNTDCNCCCPPDGKTGWIQHINEGNGWHYDNAANIPESPAHGGSGSDSVPGANPQPTKPPAGVNAPGTAQPPEYLDNHKPNPAYDPYMQKIWHANPWYAGWRPGPGGSENPEPQTEIGDSPGGTGNISLRTQLVCVTSGTVLFDWSWSTSGGKLNGGPGQKVPIAPAAQPAAPAGRPATK